MTEVVTEKTIHSCAMPRYLGRYPDATSRHNDCEPPSNSNELVWVTNAKQGHRRLRRAERSGGDAHRGEQGDRLSKEQFGRGGKSQQRPSDGEPLMAVVESERPGHGRANYDVNDAVLVAVDAVDAG